MRGPVLDIGGGPLVRGRVARPAGIAAVAEELQIAPAPASRIAVVMLSEPGVLVEIEATAVVA